MENIKRFVFYNGSIMLKVDNYGYFIDTDSYTCVTSKDLIDEEDIHYFNPNYKKLSKNTEVELKKFITNLYGIFLYVTYKGKDYCVKSNDLIFKENKL